MPDKTKVFISWSGEYSKQVAIEVKKFLQTVFDQVDPFVSDRDIAAGQRPMAVIQAELDRTSFGIVVVTKANQHSGWINFEAGALSKEVSDSGSQVVPLLMDMASPAELTGPIAQFQAKKFGEAGIRDILNALAKLLDVPESTVRQRLEWGWAGIKRRVEALEQVRLSELVGEPRTRSLEDMVEETLTIVRGMSQDKVVSPNLRFVGKTHSEAVHWHLQHALVDNAINGRVGLKGPVDDPIVRVELYGPEPKESGLMQEAVAEMTLGYPDVKIEFMESPF